MIKDFLPFPRGATAAGGPINPVPATATAPTTVYGTTIAGPTGLVTVLPTTLGLLGAANQFRPDLAGWISETRDTVLGTNVPMKLRCVQNGSYWLRISRLAIAFSATAKHFGSVAKISGSNSTGVVTITAGEPAKLIDPAYNIGAWIAPFDWFWVVEEGPALGIFKSSIGSLVSPAAVMANSDGTLMAAAAASSIIGTTDGATATTTGSGLSGSTNTTGLYYPGTQIEASVLAPVSGKEAVVWCKAGLQYEEAAS